ncbi:MAG: hypothetical protein CVU44_03615 [Chloroflexi bacterium HGW-Chloroflexi-6]|nr:MAG: hypothetical protein CVU44_03615 [Chloroflexi bacterium HGW-Chloroflexi-6]
MNKSTFYSLSLSTTLLLLALGGTLLIAPHLLADYAPIQPGWQSNLGGAVLIALSFIYYASMVLDYTTKNRQIIGFICAGILSIVCYYIWKLGFFTESIWLGTVILALLLSPWAKIRLFDWLQIATLVANLIIGASMLAYPGWVARDMPALHYEPMRISMAVGFMASAFIAIISGLYAEYKKKEQWHLLSIPWILWVLLAGLHENILQIFIASSAILGLLSSEIVPWEKVILRESKNIGRRFFHIVRGGESVSLVIVLSMLTAAEHLLPASTRAIQTLREIGLYSMLIVAIVGLVLTIVLNLSLNGLFSGLNGDNYLQFGADEAGGLFSFLRSLLSEPFRSSQELLKKNAWQQREYERLLTQMVAGEKRRMSQLNLLQQLNLELETVLDPPVSAQLTANAVQTTLGGELCAVLEFDSERNEMSLLATSGPAAHSIPPGYRQGTQSGLIGRAARLRRSQLVTDTRLDPEYIPFEHHNILSELVVPILFYNQLKGCIVIDHSNSQAFDDSDIRTLETIALRLVSSWQRSDHDQRLTRLIQAGVNLSTTLEVEAVISQIAEIAKKTLDARFVFVALVDKGGGFTRVAQAGYAPTLSSILNSDPEGNTLIQTVLNQVGPMRVRDVRKRFSSTPTGSNDLRTMLAVPIRLRQSNIGVVLAFGKLGANAFNENDEALGNLLTSQAAAAVETTWLYQELRSMLNTATQLYQLSTRVIQAEQLTDAAAAIAETTYQLIHAQAAGIALFNSQGVIEAQVQIDSNGLQPGTRHPMDLIRQTLRSGQNIIVSGENELAQVCVPLQTPRHQYGALWIEVPEKNWSNARFSDNLHTLANQAAIALERSILLSETRQQAEQIEAAFHELEITYDQTLIALSSALDARDRETEGHSIRVARLTCMLGQHMGFDATQLKMLERGAILHDIGKIGISDTILLKPGTLNKEEWKTMRLHPDIGARIIEGIPFLQEILPIIRYHQERWDGSGYPLGLKGAEIPLAARIFAVVDAYDALTTDRPYRTKITTKEALEYLREKSGELFDPEIIVAFEQLIKSGGEKLT